MEQRQLAWLITTRSQVRVLVPQPKKIPQYSWGIFFGMAKPRNFVDEAHRHVVITRTY
jgi:hypothetical protein